MLQWISASSEQMKEDGLLFICRHAESLGLPYQWSTTVNLLYTSLYDSGFMLALDEQRLVRGVIAYTYGTAKDKSADQTRIEVVLLYLEAPYGTGIRFVEAMKALIERELEFPHPIREIDFFCTPTDIRRRLFGKIASLRNTKLHSCGMLDSYFTTIERIRQYVDRINRPKPLKL
ncbi:hypothetical protein ACFFNY_17050 [Paenibacillus hodogayensis]|uniref:Uncharacterized protein n=1 Tax=Paenibacillus hodogayensis TaxID=279208 RepID=A0ABV5VYS0_9BACL